MINLIKEKTMSSFAIFLARICISAIFILSGIGKFMMFEATSKYMQAAGLPYVPYLLVAAAVVELIGGMTILLGWKARIGAALLVLYLIPVTYFFHNFMLVEPALAQLQLVQFLKNLAIFGGLLYVVVCGPGGWSFDGSCCSKEKK